MAVKGSFICIKMIISGKLMKKSPGEHYVDFLYSICHPVQPIKSKEDDNKIMIIPAC